MVVTKDINLYTFVQNNKDIIIEYLTRTIPRKSIVRWWTDSVFEIKSDSFDNLEVISLSKIDYERYLNKEFPYSYQGHCSIEIDGTLKSFETGKYHWLDQMQYAGGTHNKDVSDYLLDFYRLEQRDIKIKGLLK